MTFQIPWEVNTKSTNFHPGGVISCICYRLVAPQRLRFFTESPYDFDHYSLKSSRIFKTTTRAYKRTQNSIFSSRIASPFKKRNVTPPPTIPRTAPPGVHSRPILISRLLRMRINEIKRAIERPKKGKMEEHTGFTRENKHNQLSIYTDSHELRCGMRKKAVEFRLKGKRALKRR